MIVIGLFLKEEKNKLGILSFKEKLVWYINENIKSCKNSFFYWIINFTFFSSITFQRPPVYYIKTCIYLYLGYMSFKVKWILINLISRIEPETFLIRFEKKTCFHWFFHDVSDIYIYIYLKERETMTVNAKFFTISNKKLFFEREMNYVTVSNPRLLSFYLYSVFFFTQLTRMSIKAFIFLNPPDVTYPISSSNELKLNNCQEVKK